jgi:hypothetical protein
MIQHGIEVLRGLPFTVVSTLTSDIDLRQIGDKWDCNADLVTKQSTLYNRSFPTTSNRSIEEKLFPMHDHTRRSIPSLLCRDRSHIMFRGWH